MQKQKVTSATNVSWSDCDEQLPQTDTSGGGAGGAGGESEAGGAAVAVFDLQRSHLETSCTTTV